MKSQMRNFQTQNLRGIKMFTNNDKSLVSSKYGNLNYGSLQNHIHLSTLNKDIDTELSEVRSVKFSVESLGDSRECIKIHKVLLSHDGIDSAIPSKIQSYIFIIYHPDIIKFIKIISLLDSLGIKSNILTIDYPLNDYVTESDSIIHRLLSRCCVLDLEWNESIHGITLFLNPDYINTYEAHSGIKKILNSSTIKLHRKPK